MKERFIRCSDKDTITTLKKLGYQLLEERNGVALFLNNINKLDFDKKKVAYTNILTMESN